VNSQVYVLSPLIFNGFCSEMLPSLDNFVSYGIDVFKARAEYRQMVLDIYVTSMTSEQLGENDRVNGCKLAESILLNLRGHADEVRRDLIYFYPLANRSDL
jgi:hypothetical protein